ncbi:MAG: TonB-dependent receptor [Candidatus Eisenbacteria bacterium]
MKVRVSLLISIVLILVTGNLAAQPEGMRGRGGGSGAGGTIKGRVVDVVTGLPLEYANLILFDRSGGSQATGTITHKDGHFELTTVRPGSYDLEIKFMGYRTERVEDIRVTPTQMSVDVGTVALQRSVIALDEIEVSADKPDIVYQIDKKVINVGKRYTTTSGTAVDVLENVPSVTVDIDGNVSLRGSTSFTVLLDGRPTVLDPNDVLQQIPASTIDNIEIITNPSAKYDPDGISGIINIVTKKSKLEGVSGTVNLNAGLKNKYGADFLINFKRTGFNAYIGGDYNRREFPGTMETESHTYRGTDTTVVSSDGESIWKRTMYGARGGIDLYLRPEDTVNLEFRAGSRGMERSSDRDFDEWMSSDGVRRSYISESMSERSGDFYSLTTDYRHTFGEGGHEMSGQVMFNRRTGDEESTSELRDMNRTLASGQRSTEEGPGTQLRTKLDYTLPLGDGGKIEAGYQSRFDRTDTASKMYDYDPDSLRYEFQEQYSHTSEYIRDIHSIYAICSGTVGRLGCQGGIRGEYTDRRTELLDQSETFSIDRWDYFPTAHFSYEYSKGHQMLLSYTRRLDRPRSWSLEPFITWWDAYSVRKGNPGLKPEYIDSYELAYQRHFGATMLSAEAYYRFTHNKVERVRSVYADNVILHTIENVGTDHTFGTELMVNVDQVKWWSLSLMGNLYDYRVEGTLYGAPFSEGSFNWNVRFNNTFKIGESTRLQVNGMYNSPTASSQGERKGFTTTDAALRQTLLNRNLTATLQVRDVFGTAKFESTSEGPDFYTSVYFDRESPVVTLTLSYNFNNFKPERRIRDDEDEFESEGAF